MLTEIFIAFGVLAVGSGILIGVLALLYGKDRPTKMYLPVFPIMFFLESFFSSSANTEPLTIPSLRQSSR